ncbi:MAG: hypothetical protein Ct9H300mP8_05400 [Gammaproteobacteria bacterium]|nr:MAG: hypothetical protein Ct9H300mP8_05400 [Gammaproteobacteria bacterium]
MDAKEESTYGPATDKSPAMIVMEKRRGDPKTRLLKGIFPFKVRLARNSSMFDKEFLMYDIDSPEVRALSVSYRRRSSPLSRG